MSSPTHLASSDAPVKRTPLHKRAITSQVYERDDGLWDLEATLIDTKDYDFDLRSGYVHPAGRPVHHMQVCVTVDEQLNVVDAKVHYKAAPYGRSCSAIADAYRDLIGLNLLRGFRHAVRKRFGRTAGCTHMTELCQVLPTLAVQGISTRLASQREASGDDKQRPFSIDGCHALRADGEVVKEFHPKWYQSPTVPTQSK